MFLTTDRVGDFDDAIQSRITLALKYGSLNPTIRKQLWISFLAKARTASGAAKYGSKDLNRLVKRDLNGRQIRLSQLDQVKFVILTNHDRSKMRLLELMRWLRRLRF